jgi:transcriptional regulator with XRE-family HTH domain
MENLITQKELGERIARLRKSKGFSQVELAKSIQMSRSSLAQLELGNRSMDVLELQKIAQVLSFSLDDFMAKELPTKNYNEILESKSIVQEERVSVPSFQIGKFKNVLLYILERCAGKPNVGETVLNKLLYFADFNYFEMYEEHLTGAKYRKLPFGPVPQNLGAMLAQMIEQKQIQQVKTDFHGYPQTRFLPLVKSDLTQLKASEKQILDQVIDQMSDWSATTISNYSHLDLPWLASKEGEEINNELVFYREAPFSVRNYSNEVESP